jgi:hypothetical protein
MFNPFSRKQPKPDKRKDYETLGKQVMALYDAINPDRKGLYRTAFLKGVLTGLGSVVGATIVVALLLWILTLAHHVPFVRDITDNARSTLQQKR